MARVFSVLPTAVYPTAQTSVGEAADMPKSTLSEAPSLGLCWVAQAGQAAPRALKAVIGFVDVRPAIAAGDMPIRRSGRTGGRSSGTPAEAVPVPDESNNAAPPRHSRSARAALVMYLLQFLMFSPPCRSVLVIKD